MDKVSAWDVDRLKEDIKKYSEMRDSLSANVKKMEKAKEHADETLKNIQQEENVWKDRCLQQQEENQKLQEELEEQQNELAKIASQGEPAGSGDQEVEHRSSTAGMVGMTDFTIRQLQRKLEKEKTETEWKLKEYGWRLDQASAALCRAEEEKKSILTQIGHAVVKMKDMHKTQGYDIHTSHSTQE